MTEDEALDVIDRDLVGPDGIPMRLRFRQPWDPDAADRLVRAVESLRGRYAGQSHVPKRLADAFVDLTPLFESNLQYYPQEVQDAAEDLRNRLAALAHELFDPGPPSDRPGKGA
jgi:hypothetical protein